MSTEPVVKRRGRPGRPRRTEQTSIVTRSSGIEKVQYVNFEKYISLEFKSCLTHFLNTFDGHTDMTSLEKEITELQAENNELTNKLNEFGMYFASLKTKVTHLSNNIKEGYKKIEQRKSRFKDVDSMLKAVEKESENLLKSISNLTAQNNELFKEVLKIKSENMAVLGELTRGGIALQKAGTDYIEIQEQIDELIDNHGCVVCQNVLTDNTVHDGIYVCCVACLSKCNGSCPICRKSLQCVSPAKDSIMYV